MTDEEKKTELNDEELKEVAHEVTPPDEYPEGQAEALAERLEETEGGETGIEETAVEALEATEEASDSAIAEAWDKGVTGLTEGMAEVADETRADYDETSGAAALLVHDHHDDTTVFLGREYPVPVYTFVFGALGVLTLIEVIIAELISAQALRVPVLLGLAVVKSLLVMYFYMHLREDSRLFAWSVGIPFLVAMLSLLFLLSVPPAGY